ncbi:MAG: aminotransferase class V-fold PLP-dependent enzyme [bacterium]
MKSLQQFTDNKNIDSFRDLFPITRRVTYLNHASTGPMSVRAENVIKECIEVYENQAEFDFDNYFTILKNSRQIFAKLINAAPEEVAFTHNTSEGIFIALINLPLKEGDEIILMSEVFPAVRYVVEHNLPAINKKFISFKNKDPIEVLKRNLSKQTRAVVIDHAQFFTGEMYDLPSISEFLHNEGIFFIVDAIQSVGAIECDTKNLSVDFLASGGGKWLFGPGGTGFLYVNKRNFNKLKRLHTGWLGADWQSFENFDISPPLFDDARMFEQGTRNVIGIRALSEHIKILLEFGIKNVEGRVLYLKDRLRQGFKSLGFPIITPATGPQSGIITIKPEDVHKIFDYLKQNNVILSLRNNCLRFSPHFYNTEEEIESVLELLRRFAK